MTEKYKKVSYNVKRNVFTLKLHEKRNPHGDILVNKAQT